jgi:threonine/homoserine/homoserine lactone efflux protein
MTISTADIVTLASIGFVQLLAVMSPGPSFLITVRTAVAQSRAEGVKVALGLGAGTVVWAVATLLGLNALFHAVPALFVAMKIGGALFLLWVAYQIFRHAASPLLLDTTPGEAVAHPFWKGFMTQIANPKVVIFFGSIFVAMLPGSVPLWMAVALVAIVSFNEVWWYSALALFFGSPPVRRFYTKAKVWIDRVTGFFLGGLGLRLLASSFESL